MKDLLLNIYFFKYTSAIACLLTAGTLILALRFVLSNRFIRGFLLAFLVLPVFAYCGLSDFIEGYEFYYKASATSLNDDLLTENRMKDEHFYKLSVTRYRDNNNIAVFRRWEFLDKQAEVKERMAKDKISQDFFKWLMASSLSEEQLYKEEKVQMETSKENAIKVAAQFVQLPEKIFDEQKKSGVGGSAGLITTLELIHQFGEKDLIRGRTIAGTGTINIDGTVGPIGSVEQKILAAKQAGAEICFIPLDNRLRLSKNFIEKLQPMSVISVSNVREALQALQ